MPDRSHLEQLGDRIVMGSYRRAQRLIDLLIETHRLAAHTAATPSEKVDHMEAMFGLRNTAHRLAGMSEEEMKAVIRSTSRTLAETSRRRRCHL